MLGFSASRPVDRSDVEMSKKLIILTLYDCTTEEQILNVKTHSWGKNVFEKWQKIPLFQWRINQPCWTKLSKKNIRRFSFFNQQCTKWIPCTIKEKGWMKWLSRQEFHWQSKTVTEEKEGKSPLGEQRQTNPLNHTVTIWPISASADCISPSPPPPTHIHTLPYVWLPAKSCHCLYSMSSAVSISTAALMSVCEVEDLQE